MFRSMSIFAAGLSELLLRLEGGCVRPKACLVSLFRGDLQESFVDQIGALLKAFDADTLVIAVHA